MQELCNLLNKSLHMQQLFQVITKTGELTLTCEWFTNVQYFLHHHSISSSPHPTKPQPATKPHLFLESVFHFFCGIKITICFSISQGQHCYCFGIPAAQLFISLGVSQILLFIEQPLHSLMLWVQHCRGLCIPHNTILSILLSFQNTSSQGEGKNQTKPNPPALPIPDFFPVSL